MDIRQYITAAERTYTYRIKTCVPLEDAEMGRIEKVILKYDPLNLTNPKKTMFQSQPLDFPNIHNVEVYIVDAELGLPVSPSVLMKELAFALGLPEKFVVVRGANDPTEIETQRLAAECEMNCEAEKEGLEKAALLTDPEYGEVDPIDGSKLYGNAHASRLVAYLNKINRERAEAQKKDPHSPLFKWLDMPKSDAANGDEFNKDIKDAPKVEGDNGEENVDKSIHGNLDNDAGKYRRIYKSKNGVTKMDREADSIRKGK